MSSQANNGARIFVRATVVVAGMLAGASAAQAADLGGAPYGREDYGYVPAFSWTGSYLGAHFGGGWGHYHVVNTGLGAGNGFNNAPFPTSYDLHPDGYFGGVQAGYNFQIREIVLGIDGDISFGTSHDNVRIVAAPGDFARVHIGTFGTLTGRLGYAAGRWMPFIKGGLAIAQIDVAAGDLIAGGENGFDATHVGTTRVGWTFGAGVEYAFAIHWLLKAEYGYVSLGSFTSTNLDGDIFEHGLDTHIVKTGLSVKF